MNTFEKKKRKCYNDPIYSRDVNANSIRYNQCIIRQRWHESTKDEFWPKICQNTAFISRRIIRRIIGPGFSIPFVSSINSDVLLPAERVKNRRQIKEEYIARNYFKMAYIVNLTFLSHARDHSAWKGCLNNDWW